MSTLQEHLDDLKAFRDKRGEQAFNVLVWNMVHNHLDDVIAAIESHLAPRSESAELVHLRAFADAFRRTYPNIRQLQDGFVAVKGSWSEWDESVRRDTIILGDMVFDQKGSPRNE